jgi:uncharacterized protein (DUF58 family)
VINFSRAERCARLVDLGCRPTGTGAVAGSRRTRWHGLGAAFAEHREYQYGDDVRRVDWNVSARYSRPFVRVFDEERSGTLLLAVDVSSSIRLGHHAAARRCIAAEIAAAFVLAATRQNERVGLILFTDAVEYAFPPGRGHACRHALIDALRKTEPRGHGTSVTAACERAGRMLRRRGSVVLISDFLDRNYRSALATLAKAHDVVAVAIVDPDERHLPEAALLRLVDPESGTARWIDTRDATVRRAFEERWRQLDRERRSTARQCGVTLVEVGLDGRYLVPLLRAYRRSGARAAAR